MKNTKQLIILIISFLLILVLTSCVHKPDIRVLSSDTAKEMEAEIGIKLDYLDAWSKSRERIKYKRVDEDPVFITQVTTDPIQVKKSGKDGEPGFKEVIPIAVVSVMLNDNKTFCNIIKIGGEPDKSICKVNINDSKEKIYSEKTSNEVTNNSEIENSYSSQNVKVIKLSPDLQGKLKKLADQTGKEISFFITYHPKQRDTPRQTDIPRQFRIIPHGDYAEQTEVTKRISTILGVDSNAIVVYETNPCCSLDSHGVERCRKICI